MPTTVIIRHTLLLIATILSTGTWAMDYVFQSGYGLQLGWQTDDMVGITTGKVSFGEMEQLSFWTSSRAGATRQDRSLYAVGYQLKTNTLYYSYFPYTWSEAFDAHSIICRYDAQTQNGNSNAASLTACDYQSASAETSATACQFAYRHSGGVMRISFPAPATMTIRSLSLTAESPAIATTAALDIIDGTMTAKDHAKSLVLQTSNISVTKGQQVVLYLASPPQDLTSVILKVIATDGNGNEHRIARIMGPNVKAGRLYDIALTDGSQTAAKGATATGMASQVNGLSQHITLQGIANPTVHTEDILLDPDYSVVYAPLPPKGDVNGDGAVNAIDAITLIGHFMNNETEKVPLEVGDMNGDGMINAMDAIEIINIYMNAR